MIRFDKNLNYTNRSYIRYFFKKTSGVTDVITLSLMFITTTIFAWFMSGRIISNSLQRWDIFLILFGIYSFVIIMGGIEMFKLTIIGTNQYEYKRVFFLDILKTRYPELEWRISNEQIRDSKNRIWLEFVKVVGTSRIDFSTVFLISLNINYKLKPKKTFDILIPAYMKLPEGFDLIGSLKKYVMDMMYLENKKCDNVSKLKTKKVTRKTKR